MVLSWRELAQTVLFILGMLALLYVAMIGSSPELVARPHVQHFLNSELPPKPS